MCFKKIFKTGGWALIVLFLWELIEEGLEILIAYTISSLLALFIVKALSALAIVTATQGIKVLIKKILYPQIKKILYKKGNDKVEKIKQFFIWIWANKKTLIGTIAGATATLTGTQVIDISGLPALLIGGVDVTPIIYYCALLALTLIGVFGKGLESIKGFFIRIGILKEAKLEKKILKEAKKEIEQEEKLLNQSQAEKEKNEEKAKLEEEYRAKINAKKAEILEAQKQDNTQ